MPSAALFLTIFQVVNILGSALTVLRLLTSGLYRRYRIFFAYFVFRVPYMTGFLILTHLKGLRGGDGIRSNLYFYVYYYSEPLLLLAYILVVIELYSLVLERYKGLYTLGRWVMYGAVVVSASISVLTLLPKLGRSSLPEPSRRLMYEVYAERGVDFALVIFILLIVWFLSKYPVPLSRNVVVHTVIYSIYFLSDALVLLWRTLLGYNVAGTYNVIATAVSAACAVAWCILLSARGEEVRVQVPVRPLSEERILQQLDLLNETLLKISKK